MKLPRNKMAGAKQASKRASSKSKAQHKKPGGGAAAGGGINFQAAVTAIAGTCLLRGAALDWFPIDDVPAAVWAESESAGDDVRLELLPNVVGEIQAKKGANRGSALWQALEALIAAVRDDHFLYGLLAVAPDSSRSIKEDLRNDLRRIGEGRHDHLTNIGADLFRRVQHIGKGAEKACQRVGIHVVYALDGNNADIRAAKEALRSICADERQVDAAWNALYRDAVSLIEHRGRWTMTRLMQLFQREGVAIRDANFPAAVATKLSHWVQSNQNSFTLPAARKLLPLGVLLDMHVVATEVEQPTAEDLATALARYHGTTDPDRDATVYDAEWIGRFRRQAVVVAGPGLGKSTLMILLANRYAGDSFPVLSVSLNSIAAAMANGDSFDHALRNQALDGSGISCERFDAAALTDFVILADGLDDCGSRHDAVAKALRAFAEGHPQARLVVTTRPIGYTTSAFANWRHYRLLAPKKDQGPANLAKLLGALKTSGDDTTNWAAVAKRELAASGVADAISTSPYLLGMAAAIIASKGTLPDTRPRLYTKLIELLETTNSSPQNVSVEKPIAALVLNALGWFLMSSPLARADSVTQQCADLLATSLGRTPLASHEVVGPALRHWEDVGVIELLHHDGATYWTFVHKTFAEFAAARHMMELPAEQRTGELDRLLGDPDWHEVISFAAGLGLGDEIVRLFVSHRVAGHPGQMELAIALAGDKDAQVSDGQISELVALAFVVVEAGTEDKFSIGVALAKLAETHPLIVGPIAAERTHDDRSSVRLVAWACVLASKVGAHNAAELMQVLTELLPTIGKFFQPSLLGGIHLRREKDYDLIKQIALSALAMQSDDSLKTSAEALLGIEALNTVGFNLEVRGILRARGVTDVVENSWPRRSLSSRSISPLSLLEPPTDWRWAASKSLRTLAEAVVGDAAVACQASPEPERMVQFGALIALVRINEVPASDVYHWAEPYDVAAVRTIMQALVRASEIDPQALAIEAAAVLRLDESNDQLLIDLPTVDIPNPDWHKAAMLISDFAALMAALNHGSISMAYVAGNIMAASKLTEQQSRALLDTAVGSSLWGAANAVREQLPVATANAIILDRLTSSLPEGAEHLFNALTKAVPERSSALCEAIRRGIASQSGAIAIAAATIAKGLGHRGEHVAREMIVDAYDFWLMRDASPSSGIIPSSPRETLLEVLILQDALDDDRLLAALTDTRSDVREVAEKHMLDKIAMSNSFKNTVIERIVCRSLSPAIAANLLRSEPPLSHEQIEALEGMVGDTDPKWRRAGVELLRLAYLSADRIAEHAETLAKDEKDEIRQAAERRLAATVAK